MYHIHGTEFSDLFSRGFNDTFRTCQSEAKIDSKLHCKASEFIGGDLHITHFRGSFDEDIHVAHTKGSPHVSLHLQLNGSSTACIRGFDQQIAMKGGEYNVLNCVDPSSSFTFSKQRKYEYLSICLEPSFFQRVLEECGRNFDPVLQKFINKEPFQMFNGNPAISTWLKGNLLDVLTTPLPADLHLPFLRNKTSELLILSLAGGSVRSSADRIGTSDYEKLIAVRNFLNGNFLDKLSLSGLAREFQLNEFKLKKGFKERFGFTVMGYVQNLRLKYAYQLILTGQYTVGEVGLLIGYQTDASFIRAFKMVFNCSPGKLK